jgi:hypothetical protein
VTVRTACRGSSEGERLAIAADPAQKLVEREPARGLPLAAAAGRLAVGRLEGVGVCLATLALPLGGPGELRLVPGRIASGATRVVARLGRGAILAPAVCQGNRPEGAPRGAVLALLRPLRAVRLA